MKWQVWIVLLVGSVGWCPADIVSGVTRNYIAGLAPDGDGDAEWEEMSGGTDFQWTFQNGPQIDFDANDPLVANLDAAYSFPDAAAHGPGGNVLGSSDHVSFELWFKPDSLSGRRILFEAGGSGNGVTLLLDEATLYFIAQTGAANRMTTSVLLPPASISRFNQVVGTLELEAGGVGTMRLFLNGGAVLSDSLGSGFTNWAGSDGSGLGKPNGSYTGNDVLAGAANFDGKIGILRQYTAKVLTPEEVRQNYDSLALSPPEILSFTATPTQSSPGQFVTLFWSVADADSITIEPGGITSANLSGIAQVNPAETRVYTLAAISGGGTTVSHVQVVVNGLLLEPVLNEFMADNDEVLFDGDGNASDWIEIYNPNVSPMDFSGWFLTDDPAVLDKWAFPDGTVLAGLEYRLLFASGNSEQDYVDGGGFQHTDFRLSADGEYLGLVKADGVSVVDAYAPAYPEQREDISYGRGVGGLRGYLDVPTPGEANGESFVGFVGDTRFSMDRGFYTNAFTVAITSQTTGVEIRYTLDGSAPTESSGIVYSNEIPVSSTTVLRAAGFKPGFRPSNVDTQTYLFLSDVIQQPAAPAGFPPTWGTHTRNGTTFPTTADYEMDPMVVTNAAYVSEMIPALKQIPTVSFTMANDDWFSDSAVPGVGGIYANPTKRGDAWEREVSMEFMYPHETNRSFQVNAGIRILGNITRNAFFTRKHTLRVAFREQYGTGRLKEQIFDDSPNANFNKLVFRGHHGNSWMNQSEVQRTRAQYIRDEWMHHAQRDMGWASIYGQYVHLYINGLYWGLYNMVERPDADFAAAYFGGKPDDYDALNSAEALDGDTVAYEAMIARAEAGITNEVAYQEIQSLVNVTNLTDYMMLVMGAGETDWDGHNWYAAKHRNTGRYHMFCWDMEHVFEGLNDDRTVKNTANRPTRVFKKLQEYPEYRLLFADRMRKHFFNDGVMTAHYFTNSWAAQVAEIDQAIVAESARWGDWRRPGNAYTRNVEWMAEIDRLYNTIMPVRGGIAFQQFKALGLYPDVAAPDFSQWGGVIPQGDSVTLTAAAGTIYYTLDGTDPREYLTGNIQGTSYAEALTLDTSTELKARVLDGGEWSALTQGIFTLEALSPLRVVELMYHPLASAHTNRVESDYEYIELMNTGTNLIGLAGIHFSGGIDFDFTGRNVLQLPPGERVLVVKNVQAFEERYGTGARIAGEFETIYNFSTKTLDNAGETLELRDGENRIIQAFAYQDAWYEKTDGNGFSLVVRDPVGDTNAWNSSTSWAASFYADGTPGDGPVDGDFDALPDEWELAKLGTLTGDAAGDLDGDGFRERGEWVAGTDPNDANSLLELISPTLNADSLIVRWPSVSNRVYTLWQHLDLQSVPISIAEGLRATPPINVHTVEVDQVQSGYLRVSVDPE